MAHLLGRKVFLDANSYLLCKANSQVVRFCVSKCLRVSHFACFNREPGLGAGGGDSALRRGGLVELGLTE